MTREEEGVVHRPIWIGREHTYSASRTLGRPRIWAGLAGVRRSGPFFFFSANRFFLFAKCLQGS
jgi:hypothetical protein